MRNLLIILLFMLSLPCAADESYPTVSEILKTEGQLAWSDGSSYYLMKKNGTFRSGPLGMGGRTIQGRWTAVDNLVTVRGIWGRVNGACAPDDERKMVVGLSPRKAFRRETVAALPGVKFHEVYFEIEELVTIKK